MNEHIARGRLRKALARQYNFDGTVMSLGQYIRLYDWHRKSANAREYARKKRRGEYAKLRSPKAEYTIWRWENGQEVGIEVPRIVWDTIETGSVSFDHKEATR